MKVAVCCIAALENLYIREFVEYYKNLGFDKIFIYDNNKLDGETFDEVIKDYIESNYVDIINYRDKTICQLNAYNDCIENNKNEYEWIMFIDCDEFLTLNKHKNIHDYLNEPIFNDTNVIHINWKIYTDNNLVYYENKPLIERFTEPADLNIKHNYIEVPDNYHIKSIVRTCSNFRYKLNTHAPIADIYNICRNECGNFVKYLNSPWLEPTYNWAYIKHFTTKTIEEYINIKQKRGYADGQSQIDKYLSFDSFFEVNVKTKEKINYINNKLNINYA